MASAKRIESDEAYDRSLAWLVSKSIELEDPLLDLAKREKLHRHYDFVADAVQRYRRGQLVREYPGLRDQYKKLGWEFDELEHPESQKNEPAAEEQQRTQPASALASWLDDD
ncbi:Uncharacterised protein [Mycobacterium tuberculosis]|nr:Uncharacterised protein [Mycobacterium tuberculosis]